MALAQKLDKTKKAVVTGRKARRKLEKLAKKDGAGKTAGDGKTALIESLWRKGGHLVRQERFDAAEKVFREILSHLPDHARGHYILAQLVDRRLGANAAYPLFVRAAALDAGDGLHFDGLGRCLMKMSVFEAAVVAFSKAIALDPVRADLYVQLARAHFGTDDPASAVKAYRKAIELDPDLTIAHFEMGNQYEVLGDFDAARTCYARVLEVDPDYFEVHLRLATMGDTPMDEQESGLARLSHVLEGQTLTAEMRSRYLFAAARIHQRQKRYDEAFDHFRQANDIMRARNPLDRDGLVDWFDRMIAAFTAETIAVQQAAGSRSELPVFIVGMPRSGTTLCEQIVSSHPLAVGAGELKKLDQLVGVMTGLQRAPLRYPDDIACMASGGIAGLAADYLAALTPHGDEATARITDKYVFNFAHIGLISVLFPKARIIHCRRDPLDSGLSSYFQNFTGKLTFPFWHDLGDIGFFYRQYERIMAHWHEVVPGRILDVQYEDMVGDQERMSRRVIDFVGLEWDDACLRFYENKRAVATASVWQVRQKVYSSSVGRWRDYETHIEPLRRALAGED
jgi:tetratricopeptide (TPR) repeat protein